LCSDRAGDFSVSLGTEAGRDDQGTNSIALGHEASQFNQGDNCISIGYGAGKSNLGKNSIALGTNASQSGGNYTGTITLNATGNALNPTDNSRCYIAPIRNNDSAFIFKI